MSAVAPQAPARPWAPASGSASRPVPPRRPGPGLRLAPPPQARERGRTMFVTGLVALLAAGLAALLLLHTWAAQDGFTVARLQHQQAQLQAVRTGLMSEQQRLESPAHLQTAARALGMQPMTAPRFVVLRNGRVVARGSTAPPVAPVSPPATPTAGSGRHRATHGSAATSRTHPVTRATSAAANARHSRAASAGSAGRRPGERAGGSRPTRRHGRVGRGR